MAMEATRQATQQVTNGYEVLTRRYQEKPPNVKEVPQHLETVILTMKRVLDVNTSEIPEIKSYNWNFPAINFPAILGSFMLATAAVVTHVYELARSYSPFVTGALGASALFLGLQWIKKAEKTNEPSDPLPLKQEEQELSGKAFKDLIEHVECCWKTKVISLIASVQDRCKDKSPSKEKLAEYIQEHSDIYDQQKLESKKSEQKMFGLPHWHEFHTKMLPSVKKFLNCYTELSTNKLLTKAYFPESLDQINAFFRTALRMSYGSIPAADQTMTPKEYLKKCEGTPYLEIVEKDGQLSIKRWASGKLFKIK